MSLATERNTDLAFDTTVLREYGSKYGEIAEQLRDMAKQLNDCITDLKNDGWTTPAGTAFHKMTETNWDKNIEKYASLLDTLKDIINAACKDYDSLVFNHIEKTNL